jgi:hypothetical protein
MSLRNYPGHTSLLQEALDLMIKLEDEFMYHSNHLLEAEKVIVEATLLYFDVMKDLEKYKDYEYYDEFNLNFKTSYTFMTSNYFMFKIESSEKEKDDETK